MQAQDRFRHWNNSGQWKDGEHQVFKTGLSGLVRLGRKAAVIQRYKVPSHASRITVIEHSRNTQL